jgi:hypothetical protein
VNRRLRLAVPLLLITTLAVPGTADAGISSVTMAGSVNPDPVSTASVPVSLALAYDATYAPSTYTPGVQRFTFHLDNDIAFDTTGIPQCPLASITNALRANALAACPDSIVGSGTTTWIGSGGPLNGVIDAFNGQPSSGHPTVLLHDAIYSSGSEAVDTTSVAELSPSVRGGDFGTQISIPWPPVGLGTTHLAFTLNNLEPTPGHHYWSAGCGDADRTIDYAGDFTYNDSSVTSATATQPCTPTGQRAAALKKCKKKKGKARANCIKKAKKLPV